MRGARVDRVDGERSARRHPASHPLAPGSDLGRAHELDRGEGPDQLAPGDAKGGEGDGEEGAALGEAHSITWSA